MKKFLRILSIIFYVLFIVGIIASFFSPSGRSALLAANAELASEGFSLWQYTWLAMALTGIAIMVYVATRK